MKSWYLALIMLVAFAGTTLQAQQKMKLDDYLIELKKWQDREQKANDGIKTIEEAIAKLKSDLESTQTQISKVRSETYQLLGVTQEEVDAYWASLDAIGSDLKGLGGLSPEELFRSRKEIDDAEAKIDELAMNNMAGLHKSKAKIDELKKMIERLRARFPKGSNETYYVVRGDYLWRIAGKSQIYNDPYQWMKIYSSNLDQIKNPDLIYPDQRLNIPRQPGPNQHWVEKGENLNAIAGQRSVFGDPSEWRKLWEANKRLINDPNVIYPHQVLTIPR